jgi:hypothetical protein
VGVKSATLLALPSIAVVAVFALGIGGWGSSAGRRGRLALFACAVLVGVSAFALPSGYLDNVRRYHHPVGPPEVRREHSFEGAPLSRVWQQGSKNVLRFGVEFLSLDGLPPVEPFVTAQKKLRELPARAFRAIGVDLGESKGVRAALIVPKAPTAQEDNSYWGVFGLLLVWPAAAMALVGRKSSGAARALSLAALVFTFAQAYCGPFDRWRGRYFILVAVLVVPLVARCFETWRGRWLSAYLTAVVGLGAASGVCAVLFRQNRPVIGVRAWTNMDRSIFRQDRLEQMMATRPGTLGAMRQFERLVPADAEVAVMLPPDSYEYPLFGPELTRRLVPISLKGKPPASAGYLIFARSSMRPSRGDRSLGDRLYLRRLASSTGAE